MARNSREGAPFNHDAELLRDTVMQAVVTAEPEPRYSATITSSFVDEKRLNKRRPKTIWRAFLNGVARNGSAPVFGTRIYSDSGAEPRGKYIYISYDEAYSAAREFGAGLSAAGLKRQSNVGIFAANETQWQLAALGCFSQALVVVPLYATFGVEAVKFIIDHAELTTLCVSRAALPCKHCKVDVTEYFINFA